MLEKGILFVVCCNCVILSKRTVAVTESEIRYQGRSGKCFSIIAFLK